MLVSNYSISPSRSGEVAKILANSVRSAPGVRVAWPASVGSAACRSQQAWQGRSAGAHREVHRGQPLSSIDPTGHAAVALQAQAWKAEAPDIVAVQLRPGGPGVVGQDGTCGMLTL